MNQSKDKVKIRVLKKSTFTFIIAEHRLRLDLHYEYKGAKGSRSLDMPIKDRLIDGVLLNKEKTAQEFFGIGLYETFAASVLAMLQINIRDRTPVSPIIDLTVPIDHKIARVVCVDSLLRAS